MNRSNVRIAVFSAGIVSALFLLLYLPVLIWSPPWGENGLYESTEPSQRLYIVFNDGNYTSIYYSKNEKEWRAVTDHYSLNKEDNWQIDIKSELGNRHCVLRFVENEIFVTINGERSKTAIHRKTSNPFTLWHIKWLEWMAEDP